MELRRQGDDYRPRQRHPASKPWTAGGTRDEFEIQDEIYQFKNWQPEKVRVLMSLNMAKTKL